MNKIEIKDIKNNQLVFDHETSYRAWGKPRFEHGLWRCEVTWDEYEHDLVEGVDVVYDAPPNENHPDMHFCKLINRVVT